MPRQKKQVLKQRSDGRYACRYKDQWFMGKTSDEALAAREEYKRREIRGELTPAPAAPTVGQYILIWLPLHKANISQKCYDDYAKQLDALAAVIGEKALSDVTVDDAASVWLHYKTYSASTIHRAKMLYVNLFDTAIENDLCRKNPFRAKNAQPPDAPSGSHRQLEKWEIDLVRSTDHRFRPAAMVMLYAGLRRGEALALTGDDIDLDAGVIHVRRSLRFVGNRPELVDPKTDAGARDVPIPKTLRPYLQEISGSAGIAPSASGELMTSSAFRSCWASYLRALSVAAGRPVHIQTHDFRHTYCTMLADAGISLKQAIIWMGHADEKMILKIYDHAGVKRYQDSVQKMEAFLSNGRQNGRQLKKKYRNLRSHQQKR